MVGEIVRTSAACCPVDEPPKGILRAFKPFGAVDRMQVEDRARIRLLGPGQEALIVALDKTHSAVNQRDAIFAKIFSHLIEEALQAGLGTSISVIISVARRKEAERHPPRAK
jgi:hypothetical protein